MRGVMRLNLSKREITGAFIAPLTAIIIFIALIWSFGLGAKELGKIAIYATLFSYVGMFFVGIPIVLGLKKPEDLRLVPLALLGGVAGLFIYSFSLYVYTKGESSLSAGTMIFGFLEGMIVAITYGVIAKIKIRGIAS